MSSGNVLKRSCPISPPEFGIGLSLICQIFKNVELCSLWLFLIKPKKCSLNRSRKLIPQNQQLTTVASAGSSILSSKVNKFSAASHFSTTPARTMSGMIDHATMWKAERVSFMEMYFFLVFWLYIQSPISLDTLIFGGSLLS